MEKFLLKHKNDVCGVAELDVVTGQMQGYESISRELSPFLGNACRRWICGL